MGVAMFLLLCVHLNPKVGFVECQMSYDTEDQACRTRYSLIYSMGPGNPLSAH
jgi:hypothetical protein